MVQRAAFIDQNKASMDPAYKAEAIKTLPQLVRQRSLTDQALKQTQSTLSKLVDAHSALLRAVTSKADVQAEFSALIAEGQRIKSFYDSLQKKG